MSAGEAVGVEDLGQDPVGGGDLRRLGLGPDAEDLVGSHAALTPAAFRAIDGARRDRRRRRAARSRPWSTHSGMIGLPLRLRLFEGVAGPQAQRAATTDLLGFKRLLESGAGGASSRGCGGVWICTVGMAPVVFFQ